MQLVSRCFGVARGKAVTLRAGPPLLLFAAAYVTAWSYLFIATFLGAKPPPAPLFPPGAVLLCALLLTSRRHWWRFLVAAFLIQVPILAYVHVPPLWNLLGFIPDAVEAVVAAMLIRRYLPLSLRFARLREVSIYTACAATAVLISGTLGSAVNAVLGGEPYGTTLVGWYLSDVLACLVLAPTIMLWLAAGANRVRARSRGRSAEATLLYGGLLLMCVVVFNTRLLGPEMADALIYLPVPLLVWAAVRFGSIGISSALSLIAVLAVPAVADARGPFASQSTPAAATLGNVFTLQLFLLVIGVPLFFLAALMQEHRETKATLQESEARFRAMADTAPVLIWMSGTDTLCTFFNTVWLTFTGRSLEQELGNGWAQGVHPDDYERCLQTYLAAFHACQRFTLEYRLRRFDGEYRWLVDNGVPRFAPDGSFAGYIGSAIDMTEREQLKQALQASEARYRDLVESQTELVCRYLPDSTLTFVNEAFCRMYRKPRKELIGTQFLDHLDQPARDHHTRYTAALLLHPHTSVDEHEVILPDGSIGWQQWVDHPIYDAAGHVVEIQAVGRDITERKRAEEALRESEARFRAAFESAAVGMALVGLDGHPLQVNHALVQMLGYSEEEARTHAFAEFTFPDDVEPNLTLFQHAVAGDIEHYHVEKRYLHKDGHLVWGHLSAGVVRNATSKPLYLVNHLQDITERKQAEQAVRASEARYRAVVRNFPQGSVLLFGEDLRHVFADGPGLQAAGLTRVGVEGNTVWEAFPPDVAGALEPPYRAALEGRPVSFDLTHNEQTYSVQVVPIQHGATRQGMVILQEVTEQRRARDELEHERTRAAMLGTLSQQFRTLAEHSPDLIARFDPFGRLVYINQAGAEQLGLAPEQVVGKTFADLGIPQDLYAPWAQALREVVETGVARTFDIETQAPDSQARVLHVRFIPEFTDDDGTLVSVLGIATDVSALKRAEARLAEQASELEAIFEAQADVVIVYDKHRRFVRGNPAWEAFLQRAIAMRGLSTQPAFNALPLADQVDWLKRDVRDERGRPIPDEDRPTVRALRGEIVTGSNAVDERFQSADGQDVQMSVSAAPIRDRAGQITGAVLVGRDVTARRQLERQAAEQASELEAIFEAQADGMAVYDLQGRFVRANSALRQLFGFDADAYYTARPLDERAQRLQLFDEQGEVLPPEQWPHWRVLRGEILTGASALEGRVRTVDGRELWISITGAPARDHNGQITRAVLITRDVTARRQLERQAAEQAAAAERTRLAHELHDTVTQEIFSAGLLAESIARNWPEHRAEAEAALAQLPALTRGALAGLRVLLLELRPTTLEQVPLAVLLRQLGEAMSARAQVPIAVQLPGRMGSEGTSDGVDGMELEPPLPLAVKVVFYRVAQEALMNAAKHANAHAISVQLRPRDGSTEQSWGRRAATIELEIADDGWGFDPRAIPAGHFGLAMMRERAQAVGATLQVRSQLGQGTRIVVAWRSSGKGPTATGRWAPPRGGTA